MQILERLPGETGRDYALRTIKDNIIHLELEPGSLVSENELAAEMGLSRTPVREALIELAKVKMIQIQPQRRSTVAPIDYTLVEESRFMRSVLECAVVQLDCEMAAPADLQRLDENIRLQRFYLENRKPEALLDLDNDFHRMLFAIAQKSQVYTLIQTISIHFDRVRHMALGSVKDLKIVDDHAAILEAIAQKQPDRARQLTQRHLNRYRIDEASIRKTYPQYFDAAVL